MFKKPAENKKEAKRSLFRPKTMNDWGELFLTIVLVLLEFITGFED